MRAKCSRTLAACIKASPDGFPGDRLPSGRRRALTYGRDPEHEIRTGIGPLAARRSEVRCRAAPASRPGGIRARALAALRPDGAPVGLHLGGQRPYPSPTEPAAACRFNVIRATQLGRKEPVSFLGSKREGAAADGTLGFRTALDGIFAGTRHRRYHGHEATRPPNAFPTARSYTLRTRSSA
ncbi:hypothetical protein LNKW23_43320 [Paralimibaculum aggregatum]|uniref:Uncharacterized protein n=1 Tax=Paralimibaculum aggregatum TaxID=3036245 RepID=A0ABQ6LSS6_9RHOB|nr:hypothetical protein LNKW23_43320 [Limibaculum sp. NKW23]